MANRIQGRPRATTHAAIEEATFKLFEERGFESTTMDDIAAEIGIGRRTLFRYYPSKNDILWGRFEESLADFEAAFARLPADLPLTTAVTQAVIWFNDFPDEAMPQHRRRMSLLLGTPALMAHSELRYAAWRGVIERYVAQRLDVDVTSAAPVTLGRVNLALALSAYDQWLRSPGRDLLETMREVFDVHASAYREPPSTSPS